MKKIIIFSIISLFLLILTSCGASKNLSYYSYKSYGKEYVNINGMGGCQDLELVVPNKVDGKKVLEIATAAFRGSKIISVKTLKTMHRIGSSAFANCSRLTYADFTQSQSLDDLGSGAFENCYSLEKVSFYKEAPLKEIESRCFANCIKLTVVNFSKRTEKIGNEAFFSCSSLTQLELPNALQSIGSKAFADCFELARLVISDSIQSIASDAFDNCLHLERLHYRGTVEEWSKVDFTPTENSRIIEVVCSDGVYKF